MIRPFLKYILVIGASEGFGSKSCNFIRHLKFETRWHPNFVYTKTTIILKFCYNLNSIMFILFLNYILNEFIGFGYRLLQYFSAKLDILNLKTY